MEWAILIGVALLLVALPRLRMLVNAGGISATTNDKTVVARGRVRQLKFFWIHCGFYLITMLGGMILGLLLKNERAVMIVGVVWGLAVVLQAFMVFVIHGGWVRNWERRQIEALLQEDER